MCFVEIGTIKRLPSHPFQNMTVSSVQKQIAKDYNYFCPANSLRANCQPRPIKQALAANCHPEESGQTRQLPTEDVVN
jgi:hypothetical protein